MAIKEAEVIINASKEKATSESQRIAQVGDTKLSEIQSTIDANFDEAVKHVVSTVLKA
jgi:V/A-type H+-transporting ATPase subunit G/H